MLKSIAKPFGWLLMQFYNWTGNYGVAVILFAIVVKLILLPFQMKSKRSMMQTSRLQPRLKELEKKHGANKQKYNEEVQKLYREEKINPMSGCIWSLIPFPILIALYQAIREPLTAMMGVAQELLQEGGAIAELLKKTGFVSKMANGKANAYIQIEQCEWISRPENFQAFAAVSDKLRQIDYSFLGMNLGEKPAWNFLWTTDWSDRAIWLPGLLMFLIPIISAVASYLSSKISTKMNGTDETQQQSMGAMLIMMPLLSLYIGFIMPTALGIYWFISTVLGIVQDIILTKYYTKKMAAEDEVRNAERAAREAELEEKRRETERKKAENATERNKNTSKRKQAITERQERMEKAQEWDRLHTPVKETEIGPSQVGTRKYARGRAYDPQRFDALAETPSDTSEIPELEDIEPELETDEEALLDAAEEAEKLAEAENYACEDIEESEEEDEEEPDESDEEDITND